MIYQEEDIDAFIKSIDGKLSYKVYYNHLSRIKISFSANKWLFNAWFDFKEQTAHTPVYWFNRKPRGGFQLTIGNGGMAMSEFFEIIKEIVETNSIRLESRKQYINNLE